MPVGVSGHPELTASWPQPCRRSLVSFGGLDEFVCLAVFVSTEVTRGFWNLWLLSDLIALRNSASLWPYNRSSIGPLKVRRWLWVPDKNLHVEFSQAAARYLRRMVQHQSLKGLLGEHDVSPSVASRLDTLKIEHHHSSLFSSPSLCF